MGAELKTKEAAKDTKETAQKAAIGEVSAGEQFARDFADRWQKAWNARMPERVTELCTEDVSWEDPLTERPELSPLAPPASRKPIVPSRADSSMFEANPEALPNTT